jgi:ABC-type dipeptide/oligopeptide/nickel transport system permease component
MASLPAPLSDIALLALVFFGVLAVLLLGWKAGKAFASMAHTIMILIIASAIIAALVAIVFIGSQLGLLPPIPLPRI